MPNDATNELKIQATIEPKVDKPALSKAEKELKKLGNTVGGWQSIQKQNAQYKKVLEDATKATREQRQSFYEQLWGDPKEREKQAQANRNALKKTIADNQRAMQESMRSSMTHEQKQSMYEQLFGDPKAAAREQFFGKLKESVSSLGESAKTAFGYVKEVVGAWGGMALTPMKRMASAIKETTKHFNGFFSAIKRIAIYRAIRGALKAISQGFQEGIQNAYQWSVVTGNQFARSMDMMATSALYLKNSLGAMAMPLVNYLAPILDRITDQFVELINVVNRFIATITGASSWVKALKYPAQYMEQAAGSAKELKNQLLGFDDLNVLNAPKSGGSGASMDYSKMFEQVELSLKETTFTKALQEAIKNSDWEAIGELLGQYLNDMINDLKAKDIAKWLSDKLNAAISLVHSLLKEFSFRNIGEKISEFISNLQLDWGKIASIWVSWNFKIVDILIGMIEKMNWANVGNAIGTYFSGLFHSIADWLESVDWIQLGTEIGEAIKTMFQSINWRDVGLGLLRLLAGMLNAVFSGLGAIGKTIIKWIAGDSSVTTSVDSFLNKLNSANVPTQSASVNNSGMGGYNVLGNGGKQYVPLANGGFPKTGTAFIAGEAGAEWVGDIGGRTGVYNADQMANSLASANEGVVNTLVSVGNAIVGAINRKDTSINVTDIRRALNTTNMRYGV